MKPYHKIQTMYKRNPNNSYKTLLEGEFALPEFEYLASNQWVWTEKIDGTNIRVDWNCENIGFGGRTDRAQMPPFLLEKLEEMFSCSVFAELYPETPMTLYGEGYGARIQKGGGNYIPDGVSFILFDILIDNHWLEVHNIEDIANNLGVNTVPIIDFGTLHEAYELAYEGFQSKIGTQIAEGLVMRPEVELLTRRGKRVISKIKYKDFVR